MAGFRYKGKGIVMAVILAVCTAGCGSPEVEADDTVTAVVVDMKEVAVGDLTLQNSFVGTVYPQESVYVIPFASGTVTEVNYEVGDMVSAGDVLFRIDDEAARLQLRQAELTYTNTRQQADMATGSQQTSTDLQLESTHLQVLSNYEQAQIQYFQLLSKRDEAEQAVNSLQARVNENQRKIDDLSKELEDLRELLSGGDSQTNTDKLQELQDLRTQQTLLEYQLNEAKSGYQSVKDAVPQAESAYHSAEAALKLSEDSQALAQGTVREDTQAQLATGLQLAQLGVESARLALSYYTVTAPISGKITGRNVEVNSVATSSSPAFIIADEDSMTVLFQVGENIKNTLSIGDVISVERGSVTYAGHITEIGLTVNQQTGLFQVKASVEAGGEELPGGVSVKITADTYRQQGTVVIPYDAVYYDNEGAYVYLCVDKKAAKTRVTTGIFDDSDIVVTEGIKKGDILITSWSARLLDGVEVVATDSDGVQ